MFYVILLTMILSPRIKKYYYQNIDLLHQDKVFHFASRMAAWDGDKKAFSILKKMKSDITNNDDIKELFKEIINKPQSGRRNAHELRKPFFAKYPLLYGVHGALFRLRHLWSIYGIDARREFFEVIEKKQLDKIYDEIIHDQKALRILSTFAVNFIYLYKTIALEEKDSVDPTIFVNAANAYDLSNPTDIQLKIYLFTHCIIGESNFYTQHIPQYRIKFYKPMLLQLENLINKNYDSINLDNKLEFLVCCRIVNYSTKLFEKIDDESISSISNEGDFIIDRHNHNAQNDKTSFDKSEHRNVLYIMSSSSFEPHSTIV